MSIEASEWARRQWVGDANGKSLLRAVADYAGEEGTCFPSLRRLARDCEFSQDTVRRRLKQLEDGGWLVRIKSWMDEHGRRNTEGKGRETSYEIRLLLSRQPTEPTVEQEEDQSQSEGLQPATPPLQPATPPLQPARGTLAVVPPLYEPSLEKKETPNPLSVGVYAADQPDEASEGRQAGEQGSEAQESFKLFAETFPAPIADFGKTLAVWSALTQGERADAIRGARGYRAFMEAERRRGSKRAVKDAHRWLRDKLWLGYLDTARAIESAAAMKSSTSAEPEGRAWLALHAAVGAVMPYGFNREPTDKFQMPASIPPAVLAFADLVNVRGVPDKRSWLIAELGTEQAAAWSRFFTDTIKRMPRIENHDGRRGFLVPWEWPPRKDGSTAPPANIGASESELADFK